MILWLTYGQIIAKKKDFFHSKNQSYIDREKYFIDSHCDFWLYKS